MILLPAVRKPGAVATAALLAGLALAGCSAKQAKTSDAADSCGPDYRRCLR